MSNQGAAIRRRKQAQKGLRHLPPMKRPKYRAKSAEKADRQARRFAENRKRGLV